MNLIRKVINFFRSFYIQKSWYDEYRDDVLRRAKNPPDTVAGGFKQDAEMLRRDWEAVGNDLWSIFGGKKD